jgi:hypothetical protein
MSKYIWQRIPLAAQTMSIFQSKNTVTKVKFDQLVVWQFW